MSNCVTCGISLDEGRYCFMCSGPQPYYFDDTADERDDNANDMSQNAFDQCFERARPHEDDTFLVELRNDLNRKNRIWMISIIMIGIGLIKIIEYLLIFIGDYKTFEFWIIVYLIIVSNGIVLCAYSYSKEDRLV